MSDQIPADLADKVRRLAARFRQQMEPHTPAAECAVWECAAEAVETLLSPPPRPTLADMTPKERAACQWVHADTEKLGHVVIVDPCWEDGIARVVGLHPRTVPVPWKSVTPRPELPRMTWPGTEKPDPSLPGGWRLADHKDNGRVIVTTPNDDWRVYYVFPSDLDGLGFDWLLCHTDELTYLDGDQ